MENTKYSISNGLNSIEYSNPVEAISFKVFNIFDVFRANTTLRSEDSTQIVLLFVSLYKDGIVSYETLNKVSNVSELNKYILDSKLNEESKKAYLSIINVLYNSLSQIINQSLDYLGFHLFQIEPELLAAHYPAIFDDVIYRIAKTQGRYTAEFNQPIELTRFINSLVELDIDARVFNPFAGVASFGINISDNQTYIGQEINQKKWIIGTLRLMANNKLANAMYELADSIEKWPVGSKFDLIISNPPIGKRINIQDPTRNLNIKTAEHFLIENGIHSLKNDGKLIAVISQAILFRGGRELELRKKLVENDLIDTIISFPGGMFKNTSNSFAVMIISKQQNPQKKIRFIKADNYVIEKNKHEKVLHDELLYNVYKSEADFNDDIRTVDKEQIKSNDYNLSVNRYFEAGIDNTRIPDDAKLVKLSDLAEIYRSRFTDTQSGKVITITDLSESIDNYEKSVSDFEIGSISASFQKIESPVLLVSKIRTLKPTFCKVTEGESIYCNSNIIPLSVDETKVYIPYLILELNSERASRFVKSRLTGISIKTLNKKDLLEIPILLYSVEVQKAKFAGYIEAIALKKKQELISFSRIHGLEKEVYEQNTYLRHTLAGPVSNLDGTINNIKSIIGNLAANNPVIWHEKVSQKHQLTLENYLSNLSRDIEKISSIISKQLKKDISLSDYPKEFIDIQSYLKTFVNEFNENDKQNFTIEFSFDDNYFDFYEVYGEGARILEPKVFANKNLLDDLLNNLIDNAKKHAFVEGANNRLEIFLSSVEDFNMISENGAKPEIQILVSNTGKTLPENFTIEDFSRKGNSIGVNAGDGFGGWYITEIVKFFGGSIDLIDEKGTEGLPDTDLATSFEINLPVVYDEKL